MENLEINGYEAFCVKARGERRRATKEAMKIYFEKFLLAK